MDRCSNQYRRGRILTLIILGALVLAACGATGDSTAPEASATTPEDAAVVEAVELGEIDGESAATSAVSSDDDDDDDDDGEPTDGDIDAQADTSGSGSEESSAEANEATATTSTPTTTVESADADPDADEGDFQPSDASNSAPETTAPAASAEATEPADGQDQQTSTGDAELDLLIDELSAFVEAERGLTFTSRPQIELLNNAEFGEAWLELISDDATENASAYRNFTDIYRALGIISNDADLEQIWARFGDAGVLGYYETDSQAIRLRSGEINALSKTTLVHELVHALEDQNFNLDRESYADRDDEIGWTFSALVEGSARVIENRYRATLSDAERQEEQTAIANLPRSVSFSEFNQSFLELQFGRYNYGEVFANALWARGQSAVDQAFSQPPTSSEQVLDPSSYINGVQADSQLNPPPADGAVFEDGVFGEAAWIALLSDTVATSTAIDLANGWGGDWFVAWRDGSTTCVRIDLEADSPAELAEYESALQTWTNAGNGRDLSAPTTDVLRLTACQ